VYVALKEIRDVGDAEMWYSIRIGGPDSQRTQSKTQHGQMIGIVELVKCSKGPMVMCEPYGTSTAVNYGLYPSESEWVKCRYVTSESLKECFVGSWIFAQSLITQVS
jgi:hypothetical protein